MKISTKGRYALRMMLDLAEYQNDDSVALKSVAERQNISKKYLEQIVPVLTRAGLLKASRGYNGGYRLTRAPKDYKIGEILSLTEGGLAPVACLDNGGEDCERSPFCDTLPLWKGLQKAIEDYLYSVTLQDLIDNVFGGDRKNRAVLKCRL